MNNGRLGNTDGAFLTQSFDQNRELQPFGPHDLESDRKNGKPRNGNAVIGENFLCQRLVTGDRHAARITAGVALSKQFKEANDVLIK
jgi:hypothetical protein